MKQIKDLFLPIKKTLIAPIDEELQLPPLLVQILN